MNHFKAGVAILATGCCFSAFGANIDTFETYTGATFPALKGINLTQTGAGAAVDNSGNPEPLNVAGTPDTGYFIGSASSLVRRATLTNVSGSGSSKLNNQIIAGKLSWSNDAGNTSSASVRYEVSSSQYPVGLDLATVAGGANQLDVLFSSTDLAGTMTVTIIPFSGSTMIVPVPISAGLSGTTISIPASSFGAAWNNARHINFQFDSSETEGTDWIISQIGTSTQGVPEAETMVPVIAFAGFAGFMAWRRRAAKQA